MATPSAERSGGKDTPVPVGTMARVLGLVRGAASGAWNGWFGPGTPMSPTAPEDVKGRALDYPFGQNLTYTPRGEQGENSISFPTLRRFADPTQGGLDLLRLAIETRKNQMAAQRWALRGRDDKYNDGGKKARELEVMLRRPDGIETFRNWMRMMLEDHYVIDAPTIYFGASKPGRPVLEIVDGATIKLLVGNDGRSPRPPLPSYQQVLHGMAAVDYTSVELGYYRFNPRPNRIYGMSQVEQVVGILAIALNRQLSVLNYFTEGTVPDAFIKVPETWNIDVIKQAQAWFDSLLSGQLGERRKARFIPGGSDPVFTKTEILKNEFDEWLARIICYCFSLPPTAFVKQMNRATSETAKESAQEEGLEPEKLWFKDVMDDVLERLGAPELEWQWKDEEIADPQAKAIVISTYVGGKPIMTIDQAREMAGLPPATPEELEQITAMGAAAPVADPDAEDDSSDAKGAKKLLKRRGRSLRSA